MNTNLIRRISKTRVPACSSSNIKPSASSSSASSSKTSSSSVVVSPSNHHLLGQSRKISIPSLYRNFCRDLQKCIKFIDITNYPRIKVQIISSDHRLSGNLRLHLHLLYHLSLALGSNPSSLISILLNHFFLHVCVLKTNNAV